MKSKQNKQAGKRPCEISQKRLKAILGSSGDSHFHKGIPHDENGNVDGEKFKIFIAALQKLDATGSAEDLSNIGKEDGNRNWVNPLSGWSIDTELSDPCFHKIPAPPSLDSSEAAAEMVELYWMSLLRDLPFNSWGWDGNIASAAKELSKLQLYIDRDKDVNQPPSANGYIARKVNSKSIFRGGELFAGNPERESAGPYISQFLAQEIPYGTLRISQRGIWARANIDYMVERSDWLAVQNGEFRDPQKNLVGLKPEEADLRRHICTMRDLATYVHFDQLYEAYLNAALILVQGGYELDEGNPYGGTCPSFGHGGSSSSNRACLGTNQEGFGTFGGPQILSLVTEASTRALKAVWRQKWTHLRLRPEAYGGLVAFSSGSVPSGAKLLKASQAFKNSKKKHPSGLLPMAFPEGSPMHPAYGAGHATVAGACVTMLKAFFNEDAPVRGLVVASECGTELMDYTGSDAAELTVGLELDKLAANISIGRNMAGVHWRSDYTQSVLLGQRVAVDILYRQSRDYLEDYSFSFTTFGGGKVTVDSKGVHYISRSASKPKLILTGNLERIARNKDREIANALLGVV